MKIPSYTERANVRKFRTRKVYLQTSLFYASLGDIVVYKCHHLDGTLNSTGRAVVRDMSCYYGSGLSIKYKLCDLKTNCEYEVMHNVSRYPHDTVDLIERRNKPMFYSGYDNLTKQIIPNTMGKFKSDTESALVKLYGVNWKKENSFIEIRQIEVSVLG